MNKKAQSWSFDLTIAGVIFLSGIIILYVYAVNFNTESQDELENLFYEGSLASELVLSEEDPGILTEGNVNQAKLDSFYALSYDEQKSYFGIKNEFYFNFTGIESPEGTPINHVGQLPSLGEEENLIQVTRLTVYKSKPVKLLMHVWN